MMGLLITFWMFACKGYSHKDHLIRIKSYKSKSFVLVTVVPIPERAIPILGSYFASEPRMQFTQQNASMVPVLHPLLRLEGQEVVLILRIMCQMENTRYVELKDQLKGL